MKLGPTAAAERMKRKKVDGQMPMRLAEGERAAAQHAVEPAERALVEEGEERSDAGEDDHHLVELELEDEERRDLLEPPVLQDERQRTRSRGPIR